LQQKNCQRCQEQIICKANDINNCSCSNIHLSQSTKKYLAKTSYDCLCNDCLLSLNELILNTRIHPFPTNPKDLIQNEHYYIENGLFVFTEWYHLLKGNCCGNNCRHCAYGNAS